MELTSVYRQEDGAFVDLLNRIRIGDDLDFVTTEVNRRCFQGESLTPDITLTCTNNGADQINRDELQRLLSREYSFQGKIEGQFHIEEDKLPSLIDLSLKANARVMFTKNDEQRRGSTERSALYANLAKEVSVRNFSATPVARCAMYSR